MPRKKSIKKEIEALKAKQANDMNVIQERGNEIAEKEEEYRRQSNDAFGDTLLPAFREGKFRTSTVEDVTQYLRENVRSKRQLELLELESFASSDMPNSELGEQPFYESVATEVHEVSASNQASSEIRGSFPAIPTASGDTN